MSRSTAPKSSSTHHPKSRAASRGIWTFIGLNALLWLMMTAILIVVPDQLERWVDLAVGRAIAWALAGSVWVVAVERQWQARMGALARFPLQVLLWGSAALVAMWLSDQFRIRI